MRIPNSEPKKRSKTRLFGGQIYFSTLRYFSWYINRRKYTKVRKSKTLPFLVFGHQTPLIRPLRNVDMWLQHNKIINLRLAIAKTDSVVIRQRETFSFWWSIGKPAKSKGYVEGMVLHNKVFDFNGNQIGDELVTENHAIMMYDPLLQDGGSLNVPLESCIYDNTTSSAT